jgi:RNA polymerase sigma factor for flagellar operon FliA
VPVDDLMSIGNFALADIVRDWDPSRAKFAAYATSKLNWAMVDGLRRETHGRRVAARAAALHASDRFAQAYAAGVDEGGVEAAPTTIEEDQAALDDLLSGQAAALAAGLFAADPDAQVPETPEEKVAKAEAAHRALEMIASMPERERAILERYYLGSESLDAIARDLGITKSWASRLAQRAVLVMQRAMGAPPDEPPPHEEPW